ncbi:MAG: hypothetical protein LJE69_12335 [Thiohalocapsa sp.]|uniref:hypothetical protein n=1 Tax=Thiohalocapsa sp. TaxID=2497641 RepID=UPI0025D90C68|nr:hypothetical protein [Thiohalocapsa sp.]MCG6942024.1 hypothetical protein [Thiohalocapsa sp.]
MSAAATTNAKKHNDNGMTPLPMALLPLLILFVATLVLFWLTQKGVGATTTYWEFFLPVVAVVSLISGWSQSYVSNNNRVWYLVRQIVNWGAIIGLLYILNTQGYRELMNDQQYTGLVIYLLALGTVLAAIQMDIKMVFFAVFLVYCAFLVAVPTNNPTLAGVGNFMNISDPQNKPMLVSSLLALAGFAASLFVVLMMRGAVIAKRASKKRRK